MLEAAVAGRVGPRGCKGPQVVPLSQSGLRNHQVFSIELQGLRGLGSQADEGPVTAGREG